MQLAIGTHGIIRPPSEEELATPKKFQRMHMKERLVVLSKLGQGASSIVYKVSSPSALILLFVMYVPLLQKGSRFSRSKISSVENDSRERKVRSDRFCSALVLMLIVVATGRSVVSWSRRYVLFFSTLNPHMRKARKSLLLIFMMPSGFASFRFIVKIMNFISYHFFPLSNPEDGIVLLMLEYMDGGSLQDIGRLALFFDDGLIYLIGLSVDGGGCCDEATLASICLQAFSGLYHLHCCCQIHRDLKPGKHYAGNHFVSFIFICKY